MAKTISGVYEGESSSDQNDSGDEIPAATPLPKVPKKTITSSSTKKTPKARKSFGAPSARSSSVGADDTPSPPQIKPAVANSESPIPDLDASMPLLPLVVNLEQRSPSKIKPKATETNGSAQKANLISDSVDSAKKLMTERLVKVLQSPTSSGAVAASATPRVSNESTSERVISGITVKSIPPTMQTVRVVRLPPGALRSNPQRDVYLNELLERKEKADPTQAGVKRSLSPPKLQTSPPKKKRGRKSEGAEADVDAEPVDPPPRRDGRPRRSAAPKSFKSAFGGDKAFAKELIESDEAATSSGSDVKHEKAENKAKSVLGAPRSIERVVHPKMPNIQQSMMPAGSTVGPRLAAASPAGFDKSLEQLLQTPITLFQCQLCGIYLPRKDVTLKHIKRMHRVEDDLRAANNYTVVRKGRAQAMSTPKEKQNQNVDTGSSTSNSMPMLKAAQSSIPNDLGPVLVKSMVAGKMSMSNMFRCHVCRLLFDTRQSALAHYENAHPS